MGLDLAVINESDIDEESAENVYNALFDFYAGRGNKTDCLDRHTSHQTFYRMKSAYPEIVKRIDDSARIDALLEVFGDDIAFRAVQKVISRDVQMQAMLALRDQDIVSAMTTVALGSPRMVDLGNGEAKQIIAYPRDQVEAVRRLQELARGGVLPEEATNLLELIGEKGEEEKSVTLQQLGLGITPDFTRITAQTADGTTYTAEVKRGDVIEGEFEEEPNGREAD